MKRKIFSGLMLILPLTHCWAQQTVVQYLSGTDGEQTVNWQFSCSDGMNNGKWTDIPVPSCWELQGFGGYNYGLETNPHHEQGHYKHSFSANPAWRQKRVFLRFEGVMTDAAVTLNGHSVGNKHHGAFYPFEYDVTDLLSYDAPNELDVVVDKESENKSVNEAERRADYWVFGGIFRPVLLKIVPRQFIERVSIDARHTGTFCMQAFLNGESISEANVELSIQTLEGKQIGRTFKASGVSPDGAITVSGSIDNPKTWTSETPNLYQAVFRLKNKHHIVHEYRQRFGFRTIEFRQQDGFYVNGTKIKLKGVCRHTFHPEMGRTSSRSWALEDVNLIKDMNMNAVRMSHYPPDGYFLDICDSLGLYVLDELASWHAFYDTPTGHLLVRDMIQRDVNHPCIIAWDNGNEDGFNFELRRDFGIWDPQHRHLIEPYSVLDGLNSNHYPKYGPTQDAVTKEHSVVLPTESLHGLHDGGHGAGLDDYWELIRTSPLAAGQFLWALIDEGVVRRDQNDSIDVFNDKAPDGILGPHHEKEGSFYTIKEIWSPVYVDTPDFTRFNGTLSVANRYHFTNLKECHFTASLFSYRSPFDDNGIDVKSLSVEAPDVKPWTEKAQMKIDLPADWHSADVLSMTASDPFGREIYTWTWPISTAGNFADKILPQEETPKIHVEEGTQQLTVISDKMSVTFNKTTGQLESLNKKTNLQGPRFVGFPSEFVELKHYSTDEGYKVVSSFSGGETLEWTFMANEWLQLKYSYTLDGDYDIAGITFDYPEKGIIGADLLANGPYRVWKNRLKGTSFGLHHKKYNNAITGQSWEYPEFKGYYSHFAGLELHGADENMVLLSGTDNVYLHLFTPERPIYMSNNIAPSFPDGQISLLSCIPAVGTKFSKAEEEGPQGRKSHFEHSKINGILFIHL